MARQKKLAPVEQTVEPIAELVVETAPALEATVAPEPFTIANDTPGSTLHLGDGRKLAFGESGIVSPDVYRTIMGDDE